jgi:glutamate synthase (NADPH/NADH) large chain
MSSGEGGMPVRLLKSEYLKYFIIQIASGHFGWNRIIKAMPDMVTDPAAVLIKIGQGAKPGDGGLLPAEKVAPHIQAIRGVPKADLMSPPNHQGLYSIEESVQKMFLSMNAAFKFRVPVAIKVAASSTSVSVFNNLVRDPYRIVGGFFLDGIRGARSEHGPYGAPDPQQVARLLSGRGVSGTAGPHPAFCRRWFW